MRNGPTRYNGRTTLPILFCLVGFAFICVTATSFSQGTSRTSEPINALTVDGVTYSNVTFGTITTTSVTIQHSAGVARLALSKLPPDIQQRLNYKPTIATNTSAQTAILRDSDRVLSNDYKASTPLSLEICLRKLNTQDVTLESIQSLYSLRDSAPNAKVRKSVLRAYAAGLLYLGKNDTYRTQVRDKIMRVADFERAFITVCQPCGGTGKVSAVCPKCNGSGNCQNSACQNGRSFYRGIDGTEKSSICAQCNGTGKCSICNGTGHVEKICDACYGKGGHFTRSLALEQCRAEVEQAVFGFDELKNNDDGKMVQTQTTKNTFVQTEIPRDPVAATQGDEDAGKAHDQPSPGSVGQSNDKVKIVKTQTTKQTEGGEVVNKVAAPPSTPNGNSDGASCFSTAYNKYKSLKDSQVSLGYCTCTIVAKINDSLYEIITPSGAHALFKTIKTVFNSNGRAEIYFDRKLTEKVDINGNDGFTKKVAVLTEIDKSSYEDLKRLISVAYSNAMGSASSDKAIKEESLPDLIDLFTIALPPNGVVSGRKNMPNEDLLQLLRVITSFKDKAAAVVVETYSEQYTDGWGHFKYNGIDNNHFAPLIILAALGKNAKSVLPTIRQWQQSACSGCETRPCDVAIEAITSDIINQFRTSTIDANRIAISQQFATKYELHGIDDVQFMLHILLNAYDTTGIRPSKRLILSDYVNREN